MTFGPIVDQVRESMQRDPRTGSIVRVIWHHQASTDDDGTIAMMVSASREVSANYTVDNVDYEDRGWARITGVVPEEFRAWTSASPAADGRALTIEVANSSGDPTWGIAPVSVEACARIAAYANAQYGVPLKRATAADPTGHLGHKEVLDMFGQGYATACPMHLDIDAIITRAKQLIMMPAVPEIQEDEMKIAYGHRKTNGDEWMICHPELDAGDGKQIGYLVTADKAIATAWGRLYSKGFGTYDFDVDRAGYIDIQTAARATALAIRTGRKAAA